jgi:hypothetical protein
MKHMGFFSEMVQFEDSVRLAANFHSYGCGCRNFCYSILCLIAAAATASKTTAEQIHVLFMHVFPL